MDRQVHEHFQDGVGVATAKILIFIFFVIGVPIVLIYMIIWGVLKITS